MVLGDVFADQPWVKVFDLSPWALATWSPFASGDSGEPSRWPNSPPFPLPYPGDGVCEPSRPKTRRYTNFETTVSFSSTSIGHRVSHRSCARNSPVCFFDRDRIATQSRRNLAQHRGTVSASPFIPTR